MATRDTVGVEVSPYEVRTYLILTYILGTVGTVGTVEMGKRYREREGK
jgi:hypothetical protein